MFALTLETGICWLVAPAALATAAPAIATLVDETATATPICQPQSYIVQAGDTLSAIAGQFDADVATLAATNQIADPNLIRRGQSLLIPCRNAQPLSATALSAPILVPTATPTGVQVITTTPSLAITAVLTMTPVARVSLTPTILGYSTQNLALEAYQFGDGAQRVAFIGGIHGGYEWNTILLAYEAIDYFAAHPAAIPLSVTLYIVPAANPDGQRLVVGHSGRFSAQEIGPETRPGRFNGNQVDLNRNWDCNWSPTALWGTRRVSGGDAPFSEVETQILRIFLTKPPMVGVVFWHSALHGVFPGGCEQRYPAAEALAMTYANAAGYPFNSTFTSYTVTGDATDWLSLQGIPAITVELTNHRDTEWPENLQGMLAVLALFAEQ